MMMAGVLVLVIGLVIAVYGSLVMVAHPSEPGKAGIAAGMIFVGICGAAGGGYLAAVGWGA